MGCAIPLLKIVAALDGDDQQLQPLMKPSTVDGYQIVNASGVALAIPIF